MIAHDYLTLCPRIKLIASNGEFCDVGSVQRCQHCLRTGVPPIESSLMSPYINDMSLYRRFFADILRGADEVVCSTADQAQRFTAQGITNISVREPYEPASSQLGIYHHDQKSRNILLIGALGEEKGSVRLFHVASHCLYLDPSVHFYLAGDASNLASLCELPNFTHLGHYTNYNDLHEHARRIYSPIAFFPAIWPETWSYTLSEILELDIPLIAPALGALGSRLQHHASSKVKLYDPELNHLELAHIVCEGM